MPTSFASEPVLVAAAIALSLAACRKGAAPGSRDASSLAADASGASFHVPAESEPHARTWMAWPDGTGLWGADLPRVQATIATIARTIAKYEPVVVLANPASAAMARSLCGAGVTVLTTIPVDDCWMRDSGPIFRSNGAGGRDAIGTNFNGWGGRQPHARDARVAERVAAFVGVPFTAAGFVGEGGAIESDGAGTVIATVSSLINANRNPGRPQADVEAAVLAAYGARKMIWVPGVANQDITDDHIDATSRFIDATHLFVQYPATSDSDLWANDKRQQFEALAAAAGADGAGLSVTKLMDPDWSAIRVQAGSFVASYANYYVCNGAVLVAQFGDATADAAARRALAAAYPGRVIEQLDVDALGRGGGGIHCVTQQEPAR